MTEFIDGIPIEIRNWKDGKGADVVLDQDQKKYYYFGKMDVHLGNTCRFEVKDGEGEMSKKKEILDCKKLVENPAVGLPANPLLPPQQVKKMIQLPLDDFQAMMQQKISLSECKVRSIDNAVKIYAAMGKIERDPKAAVMEVILIARQLEGYFL